MGNQLRSTSPSDGDGERKEEIIPMQDYHHRFSPWDRKQDVKRDEDDGSGDIFNGKRKTLGRESFRLSTIGTFITTDTEKLGNGEGTGVNAYIQETKDVPLSEKELRIIMWKIDLRLIPVLMFIFFYTILDASALVHAKVAGMNKTLHMNDQDYHSALVMYQVAHLVFVVPSMWLMERFGAKRWLSMLVFLGGISMLLTGFVRKPHEMIVSRTILGFLEAGMIPACFHTITLMYPRKNIQWRIALTTTGGTIAGLVGSFIAFGLTDIHSRIDGWRLIFIVEGAITIIAAPITYLLMPDSIATCTYLTSTQKLQYQQMRSRNANEANILDMTKLQRMKLFLSSLAEIKSWLAFLILLGIYIPFATLNSNLPVMMKEGFGFRSKDAQVLPIPIRLLAAALILVVSYLSDRYERRIVFVVGPALIGSIGFLVSLVVTNGHSRYGLLYLGDMIHVAQAGAAAILAQNIVCDTKRSAALGIAGFLSGIGSIVGSSLIYSKDAPRYFAAYSIMAACCCVSLTSSGLLFLYLRRQNRLKQQQIDSGAFANFSKEDLRDLGDKNPYFTFRY